MDKMKRILVACGAGVATSAAVKQKLAELLDKKGYGPDKVEFGQCRISDLVTLADSYDLIVTTAALPLTIKTPYILGLAFLTGIGIDKVLEEIIQALNK